MAWVEWLKWSGALLGTIAVFVIARHLSAIVQWTSVLGFIVALLGLLVRTGRRPAAEAQPGLADALPKFAEDIALALNQQWQAEERSRRLNDPFPLPVRWVTLEGQLPSRRLVVLGRPGSGKTSLALRFTLDYLEGRERGDPVPAMFALASWDPARQGFQEWMAERLAADHPALGTRAAQSGRTWAVELVRNGWILPVLDGLDEVPGSLRREAIRHLNAELGRNAKLVLTCRADEYWQTVREADVLTGSAIVELCPLTLADLAAYLPRTSREVDKSTKWEPVLKFIGRYPASPVAATLADVLSTPLMTSMARAAYSDAGADPADLLAPRFADKCALEQHLLGAYVPAVYGGTRGARPYSTRQAAAWLGWLAGNLDRAGTRDIAWWQVADAISRRTRALLAFALCAGVVFAAVVAATGPRDASVYAGAYGLGGGLIQWAGRRQGPTYARFRLRGTAMRFARRLSLGLASGLAAGWAFALPPTAVVIEGVAFATVVSLHTWLDTPADVTAVSSPASLLRGNRAATIAFGLSSALLYGLSFAFAALFTGVHAGGPDIGPVAGVTFGVSLGIAGLVGGTVTGWLAAGRAGAAAYGTASLVAVACVWPPVTSLGFGLAVGALFGLAIGVFVMHPKAWGTYVIAVAWLSARGRLPWRLMRFLADAHERGVLRQAGGVYQFRHARLHDHLARSGQVRQPVKKPLPKAEQQGRRAGRHRVTTGTCAGGPEAV